MYATLQDFLAAMEREGELLRVPEEVSPILEISAIADLHAHQPAASLSRFAPAFDPDHADRGGKALLFEKVVGCDFPVAINVFGSYRRMELALGCASKGGFESIAQRIASLAKPQPPQGWRDGLAKAREFIPLLRTPPRRIKRGKCQEIVKLTERGEVNLLRLPLIKCWPFDGDPRKVGYDISPQQAGTARGEGRYITFAGMHTIHADDRHAAKPASHNIGMYRAQLIDETHLVMHWHIHHDGAAHWRSWKRLGEPMPIAICLGGEAVLPYAATAPLPPRISELLMAGFLNGRGIPMVRAKTVPLWVPANSEIVIEGFVSTECAEIGWTPSSNEPLGPGAAFEGPFGDHTGFYSLPDRYPIVDVTAITHRTNAVFPAIIVGLPPQEDYYLGKATERIFLPLLKTIIHDIADYHLPQFGCFHNCAFVQIEKAYPLQARRVMHAIWGAGQMAWTKFIIVVDTGVDVHDEAAVWHAVFTHCDFRRDLEIVNGPLDILDHAAPRLGAGHKLGIDATPKWPGEEVNGVAVSERAPQLPELDDAQRAELEGSWISISGVTSACAVPISGGRGAFISVHKDRPGLGPEIVEQVWDRSGPGIAELVILVDESVDVRNDGQAVLFHWCANTDPGRDCIRSGHRIAFDATRKMPGDARHGQPVRDYPPILKMDAEVLERVKEREAHAQ